MKNIKMKFALPNYKDLLRYGDVITEHKYNDGCRVLKIRYMGILYHLKMMNEEVDTLMQWDCFPYNEEAKDLKTLTDIEVSRLLMFSDRDRKDNQEAERVYWLCIYEINERIEKENGSM